MSISWKKFIQIILQFIQINMLRLVVKCASRVVASAALWERVEQSISVFCFNHPIRW